MTPPGTRRIAWSLPDPKSRPLEEVREIRNEIARRVERWPRSSRPSGAVVRDEQARGGAVADAAAGEGERHVEQPGHFPQDDRRRQVRARAGRLRRGARARRGPRPASPIASVSDATVGAPTSRVSARALPPTASTVAAGGGQLAVRLGPHRSRRGGELLRRRRVSCSSAPDAEGADVDRARPRVAAAGRSDRDLGRAAADVADRDRAGGDGGRNGALEGEDALLLQQARDGFPVAVPRPDELAGDLRPACPARSRKTSMPADRLSCSTANHRTRPPSNRASPASRLRY